MKIDSLTIKGFRGFNQEQTIDFHPELTIIYGPNSYGKTSVTEALEWLLYGRTSKVERGESKEEYKGSYRNCHMGSSTSPTVSASFKQAGNDTVFLAEMTEDDGIRCMVDGVLVDQWPIDIDSGLASKPFIMQHALKDLLHAGPEERFRGFARLLGLDELGAIQGDVVSLCTKPEASVPPPITAVLAQTTAIGAVLATRPSLKKVLTLFKRGKGSFPALFSCISEECKRRVPPGTSDEAILPSLLRIQDDAAKKIFSGKLILAGFNDAQKALDEDDIQHYLGFATEGFIQKYCALIALASYDVISKKVDFYELGMDLRRGVPATCPFCGQEISGKVDKHIESEHQSLKSQHERSEGLIKSRKEVEEVINGLRDRLEVTHNRHIVKLDNFLAIKKDIEQLSALFLSKHDEYLESVQDAVVQLQKVRDDLETQYRVAKGALAKTQESIRQSKEDSKLINTLGEAVVLYTKHLQSSSSTISYWVSPMSDANEILKHELDTLAGTEDITILIKLLEAEKSIRKAFEILAILAELKTFRKSIEQYVGNKMLDAVTNEMTVDVMDWYGKIRTGGDPDVHFSGFDMGRTAGGDIRSRRVQIKAVSYGKELVSAVSSLSESKLNALGICMSIAMNLKPGCPFGFIFIDDPIQSLDEEHGVQFIDVMRNLASMGKQVILLSHNKTWMDQVRARCRTLNGYYYEITSYTKDGPNLIQKPWCTWHHRLDEVDAIVKDTTADTVKLQQAEEEIRLVVCELTASIYMKAKGVHKNSNRLNASSVRRCLVECAIPPELTDRIVEAYETTNEAHHVSGYSPNRQRIKQYHSSAHDLAKYA